MKKLLFVMLVIAAMITSVIAKADDPSTKVIKKKIKTVQISDGDRMVIDSTIIIDGDKTTVDVDTIMEEMSKGDKPCMKKGYYIGYNYLPDCSGKFSHENEADDFFKSQEFDMQLGQPERRIQQRLRSMDEEPFIMQRFKDNKKLDLNDPSIISFERKDMKDGTEKITIIRKLLTEKEKE